MNGSSTEDVPQQVFLQSSTVLAQESPELNVVSRYLKILLIVSFKYIYNVPFDIRKVLASTTPFGKLPRCLL